MHLESKEIDERFRKSDTGALHTECLVCKKDVIASEEDYFIEKIIRRVEKLQLNETLFEYAICIECGENLRNQLSKESLKSMQTYYQQNAQLHKRAQMNLSSNETTEVCLLTNKAIIDCNEYAIHAHCKEDKMLLSGFPYAISDVAMDELSHLMSKETMDQLNDFKGKYFNGPPEYADILSPKRFIPI